MQLVPLQDLDVVFLEIETAGEDAGNFPILLHRARLTKEFDNPTVLTVIHRAVQMRDKVRVIFEAHGAEA